MKVKRNVVEGNYASVIDQMYAEALVAGCGTDDSSSSPSASSTPGSGSGAAGATSAAQSSPARVRASSGRM